MPFFLASIFVVQSQRLRDRSLLKCSPAHVFTSALFVYTRPHHAPGELSYSVSPISRPNVNNCAGLTIDIVVRQQPHLLERLCSETFASRCRANFPQAHLFDTFHVASFGGRDGFMSEQSLGMLTKSAENWSIFARASLGLGPVHAL